MRRTLLIGLAALWVLIAVRLFATSGTVISDVRPVTPARQPRLSSVAPEAGSGSDTSDSHERATPTDDKAQRPQAPAAGSAAVGGGASSRYANGAVNHAPLRDPSPAFAGIEANAPALEASGINCWDRTGDGAAVPTWVAKLFAALPSIDHYEAALNATDGDPWTVLLGWVPSRFMGPQKDGVNAAGRVIKAPTKGRDPEFYLKEYNATWSTAFDDASLKWVFQLTHRNALAVCIRERLHIHAIRCTPRAGMTPMLLHYCPCRHCKEGASHRTKGKAPGWTTAKAHVPLSLPSSIVQANDIVARPPRKIATPAQKVKPRYNGTCVQALSAPWLVSKEAVSKFAYEGLEHDLDALLKTQADENGIVLMTIFNKFWIDHAHNFLFSLVRYGSIANFVIATMDPEALAACMANRLPCFDATAYAEVEEDMVAGGAGYKAGHTRKVTEAMSWIKPRLAVAVLGRGYGFFMVDLDMTVNKYFMHDVLHTGLDLAHQCDSDSRWSINSGFYLARPNARTWLFFHNMMLFNPEENSDQTAMKLYARYDHTHGMTSGCLSKWDFNMKCNYKVKDSVKRSGTVETFKWVPFERTRSKFFWKILHATCISGAAAKILWLRTMNAWYLDDLDGMTKQPYCLVVPGGDEVRDVTATTQHSAKYSTGTDQKFLAERH